MGVGVGAVVEGGISSRRLLLLGMTLPTSLDLGFLGDGNALQKEQS